MHTQNAFQDKLRFTYLEIRQRNPAYSLRSFSRKLQISPSSLCEILSGKRRVSRRLAERVLSKIGADAVESGRILALF